MGRESAVRLVSWNAGGMRAIAAVLALAGLAAGCALAGRRVRLLYSESKNVARAERKTPLAVMPFLDKREDRASLGHAPWAAGLLKMPLRAKTEVAAWAAGALSGDLASAGYRIQEDADWKAGGAVRKISCGGAKRALCVVEIEGWLRMKDNWQVLRRDYRGEGARPALFPDEDPYELSLEEALREALTAFRKEIELAVP